jgi:hypothetical protein
MASFLDFEHLYDQPVMLTDSEKENPELVVLSFHSSYSLDVVRVHLAAMFEISMTTENEQYQYADDRKFLFSFWRDLGRSLEASLLIIKAKSQAEEVYDHYD